MCGLKVKKNILRICAEKAKHEIQSTTFASLQSVTQRDDIRAFLYFFYNFYTFIKVEYQQNSNIITDVLDYVLCTVLSNKLFIKLTLLFFMGKRSQYEDKMRIQTLCTIGFRYLLLLQNFLQKNGNCHR